MRNQIEVVKTLLIPRGYCPVELSGTTKQDVEAWIKQLNKKKPKNMRYAPSVFRYWARTSYDIFSDEYKQVVSVLDEMVESGELV